MKQLSCLMLTLILISMLIIAFNVRPAEAEWTGTVYIRADGSIDPSDAPIITHDKITYTLTDDIESSGDGIVVERDNIIIDGAGHVLRGSRGGDGIDLSGRKNVTVRNITITAFDHGVFLNSSSNNVISGNNIANSWDGIRLDSSSNNVISGNNITNNKHGIGLFYSSNNVISQNVFINDGLSIFYSSYDNKVIDNLVNGKALVYLEGTSDVVINEDAGQVILVRCSRIRVEKLNLSRTSVGIELWETNNSIISHNSITANNWLGIYLGSSSNNVISENNITANNSDGIRLDSSSNNVISGNNIANNLDGIVLRASSNNVISGNNIANNLAGIHLGSSSNNVISGNNIANNRHGIYLYSSNYFSKNNTVSGNNITANKEYGIYLGYSANNEISRNVFIDNGLFVSGSYDNKIKDNFVNGNPLVYLEGVNNAVVQYAGQVILVRCSRIRVEKLNLSRTSVGIELWETNNSIISHNSITANNWLGIYLGSSSNNVISENNITANNSDGIRLDSSSNNTINENNIANNRHGIMLSDSSNNRFYYNNFINNTKQVYLERAGPNSWDDGSKGNYWSDYNGIDSNNDGVGDTPYVIDYNNRDRYPLMASYGYFLINVLTNYGVASGSGQYRYGATATISISQIIIDHGNGTRHVFSGWYEDGNLLSRDPRFLLIVEKPIKVLTTWKTEYFVQVSSLYGTATGGGWYAKGSTITISISQTLINHGNGTRRVFKGLYEDNSLISDKQVFTLTVEKPRMITVRWDTEYEVKVSSERGNTVGSGWFKSGDTAIVSISPTVVEKGFFANHVFEGWRLDGKIVSTLPNYSFTVDNPVTIVASWRTEVKPFAIGLVAGLILLIIAPAPLLVVKRKRKPSLQLQPQPSPPTELEKEIKKYEEYLEKLEQLRKEGQVSEQVYERLKQEYEKKLEELIDKLKK
ncbi:MAG: right-handed parallel beta-helix repeat-containing protein [Ignisphaera sp.]